jgi:hypothetical protein
MEAAIREKLDRAQRTLYRRDPRHEALEEQLRRDLTQQGGPRTKILMALVDARAMWQDFPTLVEKPTMPDAHEIAAAILKGLR